MIIAAKSDIGKIRTENQDRYRVCEVSEGCAIAIVCDGMGGTHGGGIASEVAINAIYDRLILSYRRDMEPRTVKNLMVSAVTAANSIVYKKSREEPENNGMGTTCVAAVVNLAAGTVYIASVGDSRAYLMDGSGIKQITEDHTFLRMLKKRGVGVVEEDIPRVSSIITRAIGVEENVDVDYFEIPAEKGSELLICTDGLSGAVSDNLIYATAYKAAPEEAAGALIGLANRQGGKDNVTVAIINF